MIKFDFLFCLLLYDGNPGDDGQVDLDPSINRASEDKLPREVFVAVVCAVKIYISRT